MNLDQLRDELAEEFMRNADFDHTDPWRDTWKSGFDAAIKLLSEAEGEFDEKAAKNNAPVPKREFERFGADREQLLQWKNEEQGFTKGARWQFEQCKLQIEIWHARVKDYEARSKQLEARLSESEHLRAEYEHECETIREMKDKLTVSEARIKELELIISGRTFE
jgi:hypothetical protein